MFVSGSNEQVVYVIVLSIGCLEHVTPPVIIGVGGQQSTVDCYHIGRITLKSHLLFAVNSHRLKSHNPYLTGEKIRNLRISVRY